MVEDENPETIGEALVADSLTTELDAVLGVDVEIIAVLGTTMMPISQVLKLGRGAVVELDRTVSEDIEILANNRVVATGEVTVIEDQLAVTISEVIKLAASVKI